MVEGIKWVNKLEKIKLNKKSNHIRNIFLNLITLEKSNHLICKRKNKTKTTITYKLRKVSENNKSNNNKTSNIKKNSV